jgi:hypothetical protein
MAGAGEGARGTFARDADAPRDEHPAQRLAAGPGRTP